MSFDPGGSIPMRLVRTIPAILATAIVLAACGGAADEAAPDDGEPDAPPEAAETAPPSGTDDPDPSPTTARIDTVGVQPVDLPDASGTLVVRTRADTVRLELSMSGLEQGARYLPNVHEGRCGGARGPAVGSLQPFTGAGREAVTTAGAIPASELAAGGEYFVEVHGPGTAACANLPVRKDDP